MALHNDANHPGRNGADRSADRRDAGHRASPDIAPDPRRKRPPWILGLARALLRTPQQLSPRQRRWALLRAIAIETPPSGSRGRDPDTL